MAGGAVQAVPSTTADLVRLWNTLSSRIPRWVNLACQGLQHARRRAQHARQQLRLWPGSSAALNTRARRRQTDHITSPARRTIGDRRQQPLDRGCQSLQRSRTRREISVKLNCHQVGAATGAVSDAERRESSHRRELAAGLHDELISDQDAIRPRCARSGHVTADPRRERLRIGVLADRLQVNPRRDRASESCRRAQGWWRAVSPVPPPAPRCDART